MRFRTRGSPGPLLPFTSVLDMGAFGGVGWGGSPAGGLRAPLFYGTKAFRSTLCPWGEEWCPQGGLAWAGRVSLLGWGEQQVEGHNLSHLWDTMPPSPDGLLLQPGAHHWGIWVTLVTTWEKEVL